MKKATLERWEQQYQEWIAKNPERREHFETVSGIPIRPVYTAEDVKDLNEERDLGMPGMYPFTRGVYHNMYRGRLWSKRVSTGLHSAEEFNKRQREHFELRGEMVTTFDTCFVTLRGYDSDSVPMELVGRCGTPIDSLQDFEIAFAGIPRDKLSLSITDPGPFCIPAMHFVSAQRHSVPLTEVQGTSNQSDFLDHYVGSHGHLRFPPEGHLRVLLDHVEFCTKYAPKWHPLSIVGQHLAEAGATPVQEIAFALADGIFYVDELIKRGLNVDQFGPRLSFYLSTHGEFFEDIAKLRAARRMWAKIMKERFGAKDPRSLQLRFHANAVASLFSVEQPLNNIVRIALSVLSLALGGAQSIHSASYDEALWIPTERAHRVAVMTQNIIAEEVGISSVVDPLGGSYYVEYLTNEIERRAWEYIEKIDAKGGMFQAAKEGYPQREIAKWALKFKKDIDSGERVHVGVNKYRIEEEELPVVQEKVNPQLVKKQVERTKRLKRERDQKAATAALRELVRVASSDGGNVFEKVMEAVKANCTSGEIIGELRQVYGLGVPIDIMEIIP